MPRTPITSIYIVCEGRNTEPIYLERIREAVEEDNFLAITIYPDKSDETYKSDAIGLIKEAIANKSNFDEIYVVYDKDGYTKHQEALELINKHSDKIHLIFSSISFETWVLMHFERCSELFSKSATLIDKKFINGPAYLPVYEKKGAFDLFPLIKDKTRTALINSSWLRYIQSTNINANPVYDINPYSNVDYLIKRLFEINDNYFFVGTNNVLSLNSINISMSIEQNRISVTTENKRKISFTTNEFQFYVDQDFKNLMELQGSLIPPNQTNTYEFGIIDRLYLKFENNFILFDI